MSADMIHHPQSRDCSSLQTLYNSRPLIAIVRPHFLGRIPLHFLQKLGSMQEELHASTENKEPFQSHLIHCPMFHCHQIYKEIYGEQVE